MLRRVVFAGLSACLLVVAIVLTGSATFARADVNPNGDCWIDAATGKQIKLYPPGTKFPMPDPNHVSISGHQTFVRQPDDTWVDAATGQQITLYPPGTKFPMPDPNHVSIPGHQTFVRVSCPPPIRTTNIRSNGAFHPFFALEGGGGWSNTNFAVTPNFGVSGSSFIGGINGGVMFDIPGTPISIGPRFGWQGGNMSGSISGPAASPFFDYNVSTKSIFYQEVRISSSGLFPDAGFLGDSIRGRNITPSVSVGVAEVQTKFTGTSGAFQVTDTVTQTGFTGTVGIGFPISPAFLGGELDAYAQYRVIALPTATVSIPGQVQINNFWAQGITFGLEFRY